MRMDPRVLSRINDVVSVLENDYSRVLLDHLADMVEHHAAWQTSPTVSRGTIHEIAHDIRGVAATFGRPLAGQIATRICAVLDQTSDDVPVIDEHLDALNHVANLTPEPGGAFAKLVLKRLDELKNDALATDHDASNEADV